ncbi:hypothetical protein P152DRAFT_459916 [Eremomyces bilateralis CBS 781.70]|uniref:Uncharacterized protein n=1 Tax=Eremomyces bilateralis CBS 781.70 TaxID=1392243 RepID=A0A6G1FZC6_9PEZI|nr:uncharacterized protein P152DRAFT_459916 [Eremomyces bilateralis CBS 781.70]KAF1811041.1 hypothetical protein P152DRAFT_459916 [Eremomyces bilateralis CBS 781.70]
MGSHFCVDQFVCHYRVDFSNEATVAAYAIERIVIVFNFYLLMVIYSALISLSFYFWSIWSTWSCSALRHSTEELGLISMTAGDSNHRKAAYDVAISLYLTN